MTAPKSFKIDYPEAEIAQAAASGTFGAMDEQQLRSAFAAYTKKAIAKTVEKHGGVANILRMAVGMPPLGKGPQ